MALLPVRITLPVRDGAAERSRDRRRVDEEGRGTYFWSTGFAARSRSRCYRSSSRSHHSVTTVRAAGPDVPEVADLPEPVAQLLGDLLVAFRASGTAACAPVWIASSRRANPPPAVLLGVADPVLAARRVEPELARAPIARRRPSGPSAATRRGSAARDRFIHARGCRSVSSSTTRRRACASSASRERLQVGRVVDHVTRHDHVRLLDVRGDVRPRPEPPSAPGPPRAPRLAQEPLEHVGLAVERPRSARRGPRAGATSHRRPRPRRAPCHLPAAPRAPAGVVGVGRVAADRAAPVGTARSE